MNERTSSDTERPGILLTAATEDGKPIVGWAGNEPVSLLHLPLEIYVEAEDGEHGGGLFEALEAAENIIYGAGRNAEFLLRLAQRENLTDEVRQRVNLAVDSFTAEFLEERGIPAIAPEGDRAIDLVELMLRLRRTGQTFYPCGGHTSEEIPGLLRELDIPVTEFVLYELEGPSDDRLEEYRKKLSGTPPDLIICHSRRSVNRIRAAFPGLDYDNIPIVAGDRGVAEKLRESGLSADHTAEGTWKSIYEKVKEALEL